MLVPGPDRLWLMVEEWFVEKWFTTLLGRKAPKGQLGCIKCSSTTTAEHALLSEGESNPRYESALTKAQP